MSTLTEKNSGWYVIESKDGSKTLLHLTSVNGLRPTLNRSATPKEMFRKGARVKWKRGSGCLEGRLVESGPGEDGCLIFEFDDGLGCEGGQVVVVLSRDCILMSAVDEGRL